MQENRSFDHYFGSLRGVRGFGDPTPARLPSGKSVWHQPDGTGEVLPFHPDKQQLGLAFLEDLDHSWNSGHTAFAGGRYDQWVPAKTATTMAYLDRHDIPFHYALADAFTICDNYHCSLLGPTDPNRYYMWTGWVGNDGSGGGPVIANDELGYGWTTYPERLEAAGVSWKIYQDAGHRAGRRRQLGLDPGRLHRQLRRQLAAVLQPVPQRHARKPVVREGAHRHRTPSTGGTFFDILRADVKHDRLPQVSWIAAPRRSPSTATGRRTTAPGTSRRCSTRSRRTPTCGPRPSCC